MNHRIARLVFAFGVGLIVAVMAFKWITNPAHREERQLEVSVVEASQQHLRKLLNDECFQLVDPLSPDRKVGKTYVFDAGGDWEVSGYYRRCENDRWHPYLMRLDVSHTMTHLKVQDAALEEVARQNELLEILP